MSEDEKSQEGSQVEEEENPEPPLLVTKEQITAGLSRIERTHDGTSFAFVALTIEESDPVVEDLGDFLSGYEHLRHLNLSKNGIRDISSMACLNHLLTVNCSNNAIGSIQFLEDLSANEKLQFLQRLDFSGNKIKELNQVNQPRLSWLNLS